MWLQPEFTLFGFAEFLWFAFVGGGSYWLLTYCMFASKDWRKRAYYSEKTAHLDEAELLLAQHRNLIVIEAYWRPSGGVKPAFWMAENSLVMATVLEEHLLRARGMPLPHSYSKARRKMMRQSFALPDRTERR